MSLTEDSHYLHHSLIHWRHQEPQRHRVTTYSNGSFSTFAVPFGLWVSYPFAAIAVLIHVALSHISPLLFFSWHMFSAGFFYSLTNISGNNLLNYKPTNLRSSLQWNLDCISLVHKGSVRLTTFPGVWLKKQLSKCKHHIAVNSSAREHSQVYSAYCWTLASKKSFHTTCLSLGMPLANGWCHVNISLCEGGLVTFAAGF